MIKEKEIELERLLEKFLMTFPLESLQTMQLEQYTDVVTKDKSNNSFTYWVETELKELGSIKGGNSEKFGIYKYNNVPTDSGITYDDTYAWNKKLGTRENAWEIIRNNVCKIANLASEGKFSKIDEISDIWPGYKWKIAFLYSDKKIINTFSYDALIFLAKQFGQDFSKKTKYSDLYAFLIDQKPSGENFWSFGERLWKTWEESDEIILSVLTDLKNHYENDTSFNYTENEIDCFHNIKNPFIWIKTTDNIIGNEICHYEFIFYNRILYVEIHFEDVNYENYADICYTLGLKHHPRYKNRFYIQGEEIDIDKIDNYLENADSALRKLDSIIGIKIKEEILKMSRKSKFVEDCKNLLLNNYNLILHGAPGTGKTHVAKDIAAQIILNKNYSELTEEELESIKEQIGFVQFHPSFDYTDFVEGLRPVYDETDNVVFTRKDGIFKAFCKKAVNNINNMKKTENELQQEISTKEILDSFFSQAVAEQREFKTISNIPFFIKSYNESHIQIIYKAPDNSFKDVEKIKYSDFVTLYNANKRIERSDVKTIVNRQVERQSDSYLSVLTNIIKLEKIIQLLQK